MQRCIFIILLPEFFLFFFSVLFQCPFLDICLINKSHLSQGKLVRNMISSKYNCWLCCNLKLKYIYLYYMLDALLILSKYVDMTVQRKYISRILILSPSLSSVYDLLPIHLSTLLSLFQHCYVRVYNLRNICISY